MSPNVDRALGRARIPSDMVSAIMTDLVSFGIVFEESPYPTHSGLPEGDTSASGCFCLSG